VYHTDKTVKSHTSSIALFVSFIHQTVNKYAFRNKSYAYVCVCVCEHAHMQAFVYTWNSISDGLCGACIHCILRTEM